MLSVCLAAGVVLGGCSATADQQARRGPDGGDAGGAADAGNQSADGAAQGGASLWPSTVILVHGYAGSSTARVKAAAGIIDTPTLSRYDNLWYWRAKYSDNVHSFDVPAELAAAAAADGQQLTVKAGNWDGVSTLEDSAHYLTDTLDCFCTGPNTCDLVGHSTGDALIGYVLDKYQSQRPVTRWSGGRCVADGQQQPGWNIKTVFAVGGAGGGTEAVDWANFFTATDPVVKELVPQKMRGLYNHDMHGLYAAVPNIRFVGAGLEYNYASNIDYAAGALLVRGQSDGLVPFHSQGGVSELVYSLVTQAYDAYCIKESTSIPYSCGRLNLGTTPALRWGYTAYTNVPLFAGFHVQMIDDARLYNHTDAVGRVTEWITRYRHDRTPWRSTGP